jgi:hypothetical protein
MSERERCFPSRSSLLWGGRRCPNLNQNRFFQNLYVKNVKASSPRKAIQSHSPLVRLKKGWALTILPSFRRLARFRISHNRHLYGLAR